MRQARNAPESTRAASTDAAAVENRLTSAAAASRRPARPGSVRARPTSPPSQTAPRDQVQPVDADDELRPRSSARVWPDSGRGARASSPARAASWWRVERPGLGGSSQAAASDADDRGGGDDDLLGRQRAPRGGLQQACPARCRAGRAPSAACPTSHATTDTPAAPRAVRRSRRQARSSLSSPAREQQSREPDETHGQQQPGVRRPARQAERDGYAVVRRVDAGRLDCRARRTDREA